MYAGWGIRCFIIRRILWGELCHNPEKIVQFQMRRRKLFMNVNGKTVKKNMRERFSILKMVLLIEMDHMQQIG